MAETFTINIPLGYPAAEFNLIDTLSGKSVNFNDIKGEKGTLVIFICNHCPFVIHVIDELVQIGLDYQKKGIGVVAISSNDVESYPQDSPALMKVFGLKHKFPFPYLYDESQSVAQSYQAACTPDYNLFDSNNQCVYRGQLDRSRPGNNYPVDGKDLRKALDKLVVGELPDSNQTPSSGCNIKWKN